MKSKKKGNYNVVRIDPDYQPAAIEHKDVFGITFEQGRNSLQVTEAMLENVVTANKALTAEQKRDLMLALITLKYTQSNSVCYAQGGQVIGVGAGQQSQMCIRDRGRAAAGQTHAKGRGASAPRLFLLPGRRGRAQAERWRQ